MDPQWANVGCGNERGFPSKISLVVPAHNEAMGIRAALAEMTRVLNQLIDSWEIIVIDDGSEDDTFACVSALTSAEERIKGIRFSRNFGKEAALLAGLRLATGEVVVTLDADLQHPPELISVFLQRWQQGAKVVHGVKRQRRPDGFITRCRADMFNYFMLLCGGVDLRGASDFKLMDRVVVDAIVQMLPERGRFFRGLANWVGYEQAQVPFDVGYRANGHTQLSLRSLIGLAATAITSFTAAPLRIVTILGLVTLVFGFAVGTEALWSWFKGQAVSGFATVIVTLLLLGSFIMISLGIIGEYIAKVYDEIKGRPSYLIEQTVGFDGAGARVPLKRVAAVATSKALHMN